jgi:DNA-binding CsgD family transcriptional regulator
MSTISQVPDASLQTLTESALRKTAAAGVVSSEGFLLVDSAMNPVYASPEVAQILMYPQRVEAQKNLADHLAKRLRSLNFAEQSSGTSTTVVAKFQSGKRQYLCRAFHMSGFYKGESKLFIALLLERAFGKPAHHSATLDKFRLTSREREVAQHLIQGLTSKDIGRRMNISPHTVKAFIRLIMFKMGVSTRSGIVMKALSPPDA